MVCSLEEEVSIASEKGEKIGSPSRPQLCVAAAASWARLLASLPAASTCLLVESNSTSSSVEGGSKDSQVHVTLDFVCGSVASLRLHLNLFLSISFISSFPCRLQSWFKEKQKDYRPNQATPDTPPKPQPIQRKENEQLLPKNQS